MAAVLAPPPVHQSLKQRLRNANPGDPTGAFNEFFRMQFLGLLGQNPAWVLKGGTHLLCRLQDARTTKDLDLFHNSTDNAEASVRKLIAEMNGATIGRYTFEFGPTVKTNTQGHLDIAQVQVHVRDGGLRVADFPIDVSGSVTLNADPTRHTIRTAAAIPGYPSQISIALYPIENQLADKLCAMYQDYGRGPSTRYHDLYDAAMIVDQLPFNKSTLQAALNTQYVRRRMRIPADLPEPAPGWAARWCAT